MRAASHVPEITEAAWPRSRPACATCVAFACARPVFCSVEQAGELEQRAHRERREDASGQSSPPRFTHTGVTPARRAPSTSANASSPTCSACAGSSPARPSSSAKMRGSGLSMPASRAASDASKYARCRSPRGRRCRCSLRTGGAGRAGARARAARRRRASPRCAPHRRRRTPPRPWFRIPASRAWWRSDSILSHVKSWRMAGCSIAIRARRSRMESSECRSSTAGSARQEAPHGVLGPHDHRPHFPQGVVEVEDDGLDFAHRVAESSEVPQDAAAAGPCRDRRMPMDTRFARRYARPTGALELMEDLGGAGPGTLMLGGATRRASPRSRPCTRSGSVRSPRTPHSSGASRPALRRAGRRPAVPGDARRGARGAPRLAALRAQRGAHRGSQSRSSRSSTCWPARPAAGRRRIWLRSPGVHRLRRRVLRTT